MIHFHDFVYSVPQAFIEENDEYIPNFCLDEDYWQQSMSLDRLNSVSLWADNNERLPIPIPALHADEDFSQMRLYLTTTQQVSLWL